MDQPLVLSSEEEDEDIYLNSVARLKVLKMKGLQNLDSQSASEETKKSEEPQKPKEPEVVDVQDTSSCDLAQDMIQTRARTRAQSRKKRATHQRARRGGKQKQSVACDESDLQIVSVEEAQDKEAHKKISKENNEVIIVDDSLGSGEEDNYEVNVNILWRSNTVHRLSIKQNESFRKIFQHFAELENVAIQEILITRKEKPLKWTDTPASINFKIIDILEGGIVERTNAPSEPEPDCCQIRVQLAEKNNITISVQKDVSFENLFRVCADKMGVPESRIKLYFDGEPVNVDDTPESLDIEDEACFDLRVCS